MTDSRVEEIVGNLLRAGVILAAAVVLTGGIWYFAAHGAGHADYRHFQPVRHTAPWTPGLPPALVTIQIGLLLLVATPVARVVLSLVLFGLERDRTYMWVTAIVLAILAYSLAAG